MLRGRASAASTTASWSSRVSSTDRPEFRSYLFGKLWSCTGPLLDRSSPIDRPRGVGSIANFNLPKYPRGSNYRGNSPSTAPVRNEPLSVHVPCAIRAVSSPSSVGPKYPVTMATAWLIFQHAAREANEGIDMNELKHFTNGDVYLQY